MRAEWGNDEGASSAARHRADLVGWMERTRAALDAFDPDFVLIWGDDQYENFKEDIVPPYCVSAYDRFKFAVPPGNVWGETDKTYDLPGHRQAAKHLASALIEEGFDAAYAYKPLHHPLGHAFSNAILYLDYARRGFGYPIVPMAINCYGRRVLAQRGGLPVFDREIGEADLDPPAPTPRRLFDLGAATARILAASPWRVALLASSGWSHAFLTAKNHYLYPDTPADKRMFEALRGADWQTWRNCSGAAVEDSGQQEILNWMCLAGALSALERKPQVVLLDDVLPPNENAVQTIAFLRKAGYEGPIVIVSDRASRLRSAQLRAVGAVDAIHKDNLDTVRLGEALARARASGLPAG